MKLTLGERVSIIRRRQRMSQADLGARAGLSESTICRIEKGSLSPKTDQLAAIAAALGFDALADFLSDHPLPTERSSAGA